MKHNLYIISLIVVTFISCSGKTQGNQLEIIKVDVNTAKTLDIGEGRLIELETNRFSLLYDITKIAFLNEKYFIFSRDRVVAFDKTGKYLCSLSNKGSGPTEYVHPASVYAKNNHIFLYDSMEKKILCFDENGNFVSSKSLPENKYPLSDIWPMYDGNFVAKNMFMGDHEKIPIVSILSENHSTLKIVTGRNVDSGISFYDNFSQYKNEILYLEAFCDTIFSIKESTVALPKYYIDFGNNAITTRNRIGKDVYDLIDFVNIPENISKVAFFIGFLHEDDNFLRFRFFYNKNLHYVFYDKRKKKTNVFKFEDTGQKYKASAYVNYYEGNIYLAVTNESDIEENPSLVVIDEANFLKHIK